MECEKYCFSHYSPKIKKPMLPVIKSQKSLALISGFCNLLRENFISFLYYITFLDFSRF